MSATKKQRPFIDAKEVAARIGCISAKSVSNREGLTAELTRYPLGWRMRKGIKYPSRVGFCQDEVDALIAKIRKGSDEERQKLERQYSRVTRDVIRRAS